MELDYDLIVQSIPILILGAGVTLQITLLSVGFGLLIGLFVGMARLSVIWPLRGVRLWWMRGWRSAWRCGGPGCG